jgi:CHAT domain-containing protein/tetratricopeptide (TPR) repeat protein
VRHLEQATSGAPGDWRLHNDLGAAYLLQALSGDSVHLLDSLAELDRAIEAAPSARPPRFNRALVLQELGLLSQAEREWAVLLELGSRQGWHQEAEAAMEALRAEPTVETIENGLQASLRSADAVVLKALVKAHPQDALRLAERWLLERWAAETISGDASAASKDLEQARLLGAALSEEAGQGFVLSLTELLAASPAHHRRLLALAYTDYSTGRDRYDAREVERAEEAFRRAQRHLTGLTSPLEPWIDYYLALCRYWRGDGDVPVRLRAVENRVRGRGLPVLEGYLWWTAGLIEIDEGRFSDGLNTYRSGLRKFESVGLGDEAVLTRVLISDALLRLGEVRLAWSEILDAISKSREMRKPRTRWAAWDQAAQTATALGRAEVTQYFYDQALEAAASSASPLTVSNAYVARATTWTHLGRKAAARRDLREARRWGAKVSDHAARLRAEAPLLIAESRAAEPGDEQTAILRLSSAISRYRQIDARALLPQLLLERARLRIHLGRASEGERDLRAALQILETERRSIDDVEWRVSFSSVARPTLDELLRFHLEVSDDHRAIPALTDLARDPAYFAPLSPVAPSESLGADYRTMLDLLPGEALLSVSMLDDRIVLWVLRDSRLTVITEPVTADELYQRLSAARDRLSADDLAWFYDRMIRPVAAHLEGVDRLFLALDRGLNLLPVGALYDRESKTSLVERTAVTVVPAALLLAHGPPDRRVPVGRVAIVGAPSGEGLPRLPEVEAEAAAIAGLYPQSRIELGAVGPADLEIAGSWADVLQFSGHAVANPLVPGLSRLVSGDEPIYARDLRKLRMTRTRTVILAACEAAATTPEDSSGVLSLAVAFLEAGADWVVASLWPIDDRAARRFTERFHQELRRDPAPDRALRRTQLHFLRSGESRFEDWAGFQVITG